MQCSLREGQLEPETCYLEKLLTDHHIDHLIKRGGKFLPCQSTVTEERNQTVTLLF